MMESFWSTLKTETGLDAVEPISRRAAEGEVPVRHDADARLPGPVEGEGKREGDRGIGVVAEAHDAPSALEAST